jgi:NCS1 family nucleobase:cation symporter-1
VLINLAQLLCFRTGHAAVLRAARYRFDPLAETFSAPVKIVSARAVWWAINNAGGFGTMMQMPSQFVAAARRTGSSDCIWPSLTAMVDLATWPGIFRLTRFACSQRDQLISRPSACRWAARTDVGDRDLRTVVSYSKAIRDPVDLSAKFTGIGVALRCSSDARHDVRESGGESSDRRTISPASR